MIPRTTLLFVFFYASAICNDSTTSFGDIFTKNATITTEKPTSVTQSESVANVTEKTTIPISKNKTNTAATSAHNATTKVPKYCGNNSNDTDCLSVSVTTGAPKQSKKNNQTTTAKPRQVDEKSKMTKTNYDNSNGACSCDLQMNICDINCCCDQDCSEANKKIFSFCQTDNNRFYDTRYCDYMEYIYLNNTPYEWQVNHNGLFCVLKSNLPPSSVIQRRQPLKSYEDVKFEKEIRRFSWKPHEVSLNTQNFNSTQTFLYGNPMWMLEKNGDIKKFRLPKNFLTTQCIFEEDVLVLRNTEQECVQVDIREENTRLSLGSYFQNFKMISAPIFFNTLKFKKDIFLECPKNICLAVEPKICDDFFKNCFKTPENSTKISFTCNFNVAHRKNYCKNAVKKIRYNFYHDGSKGLKRIEVLAVLQNFSYEFGKNDMVMEFDQHFSVNFLWLNQSYNIWQSFSGNPGYIIGKPILTALKDPFRNDTKIILRNSTKILDNFLTLPKSVNGKCTLNETEHVLVEFAYNSFTKCHFFERIYYNASANLSANHICRILQSKILNFWSVKIHNNKTLVVGSFGNASPKIVDNWVNVLFEVSPETFLVNYTRGDFSKDNKTLSCYNTSTSLSIAIFHSRIDFEHLLHQEKILGVAFTFEGRGNFSFPVSNASRNVSFFDAEFKMENSVVFYDLTSEKRRKFVDPPSFEIKLPYDFFYPFVKVDNGVCGTPTAYFLVYLLGLMCCIF